MDKSREHTKSSPLQKTPKPTAEEKAYLDSLSPKEKKSYEIAKSHLGMSFELKKSVGFLEWKKQQQQPST